MTDRYREVAAKYRAAVASDSDTDRIRREIIEAAGITRATRRILDVGCGEGSNLKFVVNSFPGLEEAVGVDSSPSMLELALKDAGSINFIMSDMTSMPLPDNHFDLVYSRFTVHHSQNIDATLKEVARVTAPGGTFYIHDAHPISGLFLKPSHDYGKKESANFPAWYDSKIMVQHPCFSFEEYIMAIVRNEWEILKVTEGFGRRSSAPEFAPYRIPVIINFKLKRKK